MLGVLRTVFARSRYGVRIAELIEAPFMLITILCVGRWLTKRFQRSVTQGQFLIVGLMATSLVLLADLAVGVGLRGMSPWEVFTGKDAVTGPVYFGLLTVFALTPWAISRWRSPKAIDR